MTHVSHCQTTFHGLVGMSWVPGTVFDGKNSTGCPFHRGLRPEPKLLAQLSRNLGFLPTIVVDCKLGSDGGLSG